MRMRNSINPILLIVVCLGSALSAEPVQPKYLSPVALVADASRQRLYVAEVIARQVALFDLASQQVADVYALPEPPSGLVLAPDGSKLYVTGASPDGRVNVVDLVSSKVSDRLAVGHTPVAPVMSPDGKILFVCNQFDHNVSVIDLATKRVTATIPAGREPVAAALIPNGKLLFVANHLPAGPADADHVAATVSGIDPGQQKVVAAIPLPDGSTGARGICVSPDGKYVYVAHTLARHRLPTTQLERGWINTNALTIIEVASGKVVNTVLLDDVDLGAANPWDVACALDGIYLCVTHAGTHEVSVIERLKLHDKLAKVEAGEKVSDVSISAADVPNDLSFLVGLRRRISLKGNGPRGLAIVGARAYVAEYFTDSLGVVAIGPDDSAQALSLALGPQQPLTAARKGEVFFHDASLCFQRWLSCASCHPGDARVDALNWDLMNDGLGNPKNAKSLLLAHKTPPAMITGARDTAEFAVRSGLRYILFAQRPEEDAKVLDEYLKSLQPIPSPRLRNGQMTPAAQRGRLVFAQAGCAVCHEPPLYTNLHPYNVGTGKGRETDQEFDTPTLIECWRTVPYLHDGRAATIEHVLTKFNPDDRHGATSKLSPTQIAELVEFVLSL
jgi:YVTN family beta-propeller protein